MRLQQYLERHRELHRKLLLHFTMILFSSLVICILYPSLFFFDLLAQIIS
jgi:hypothetical protein